MNGSTLEPLDEPNRALLANVHPPNWVNPEPAPSYNLVVVGAGTAGLVSAAGAAGLGAKVALVEKHWMGGDCLNVGCVPSKALIRSARAASDARGGAEFGIESALAQVDFSRIMERMRELRARISPHDSAARFTALGVDVFFGAAKFTGPATVEVGGKTLRFSKAVIATGARPADLPIPGLKEAGALTNESVFNLTELPRRLLVIGGGPIGAELAQAFARFGSRVVLFEAMHGLLPREDRDAADILRRALAKDGVDFQCCVRIGAVERKGAARTVRYESKHDPGGSAEFDAVLVGAGRAPNVEGLGLESAGVAYDPAGVKVDDFLRTTNPHIYAAGDVCMAAKFTHMADAAARIVLQNALFRGRKRLSALVTPWCTYTDPEIAHVGLYDSEAIKQGIPIETFVQEFKKLDRGLLDGEADGLLKVHVKKGTGRIIGATMVARHAGEMISELTLAMTQGIGLRGLARVIHPYPTQAEAVKKIADAYNRSRLTPRVRRLLSAWLRWTRG